VTTPGDRHYAVSGAVSGRRWWERLPRRVTATALGIWHVLPSFVRAPLIPLGGLFGPHTTTAPAAPGADTVAGVAQLTIEGYEPVESHTGATWVAELWPDEHRRSVPETRPAWSADEALTGRLWLIRSPWASLTLDEVFALLWRWVERDQELDEVVRRQRVSEVLAWTQPQAMAWYEASSRE